MTLTAAVWTEAIRGGRGSEHERHRDCLMGCPYKWEKTR